MITFIISSKFIIIHDKYLPTYIPFLLWFPKKYRSDEIPSPILSLSLEKVLIDKQNKMTKDKPLLYYYITTWSYSCNRKTHRTVLLVL